MATVTPSKVAISIRLNNGQTATGAVKEKAMSLGTLNVARYTANQGANKAYSIVNALAPILDRQVYRIYEVSTGRISED